MVTPRGYPTRALRRSSRTVRKPDLNRANLPGVSSPERIADGVWIVRGGVPRTMNVYLIETSQGVVLFDAGISSMAKQVRAAGEALGGIDRVVLGHAHPDHRGVAPSLGVPVLCHADEKADAESERGEHYFDLSKLALHARLVYPKLLRHWDGGPVQISGTLAEGDEVAGFTVVHIPGHAPGLIALFRKKDGLALVSDLFYTVDAQTGLPKSPHLAYDAFNLDRDKARDSLVKLAELGPSAAWPGHLTPIVGNVRDVLLRVAEKDAARKT